MAAPFKADQLEDNILKNLMAHVTNLQRNSSYLDEVAKVKQDYEQKMVEKLRVQEVDLRAEMNQRLSEKDLELRKMIA